MKTTIEGGVLRVHRSALAACYGALCAPIEAGRALLLLEQSTIYVNQAGSGRTDMHDHQQDHQHISCASTSAPCLYQVCLVAFVSCLASSRAQLVNGAAGLRLSLICLLTTPYDA